MNFVKKTKWGYSEFNNDNLGYSYK